MAADERTIADRLTCPDCQELADGVRFYRVRRSFTTTAPGASLPTIWRPPLTCRVIVKPISPAHAGEWAYTTHALLEHPEARGAYAQLCTVRERVEAN